MERPSSGRARAPAKRSSGFLSWGYNGGHDHRDLEDWPLGAPEGPVSEAKETFEGTLKKLLPEAAGQVPVLKYNVRVGDLLLDPIIIVDR